MLVERICETVGNEDQYLEKNTDTFGYKIISSVRSESSGNILKYDRVMELPSKQDRNNH